jgi:GR25 family glycosyltransferase involved in LPS biosynthesis
MMLPIIVIGQYNKSRNQILEDNFAGISLDFINPFFYPQDPRSSEYTTSELGHLQLGRPMLNAEIGCAIAHRVAMRRALERVKTDAKLQWALILEDDADVSEDSLKQIIECLDIQTLETPSVISFYSNVEKLTDSTHRESIQNLGPTKLRRQRFYIRSGAVCYAVNKSALLNLDKFHHSSVDFVADWPPYFAGTTFYQATHPKIGEVNARSTIGTRENLRLLRRLRLHVNQISNLREIAKHNKISKFQALSNLVFQPFNRDLHGVLRRLIVQIFRFLASIPKLSSK